MSEIGRSERGGRVFPTIASHQQAVARMYRGSVALYAGVGSLAIVLLGNVFGGAGVAHRASVVGAGALICGGILMMGTAAPHLVRFGRRFAMPAFVCFAIAGLAGLVGVAEVLESFFLGSAVLAALGKWAVRIAAGFAVLGAILLQRSQRSEDGPG